MAWDAQQFSDMYGRGYGWVEFRGGNRAYVNGERWVQTLISRLSHDLEAKTVIVGCGIGATIYTARVVLNNPTALIWGMDSSPYIQSQLSVNAPVGFLPAWVMNLDYSTATLNDTKRIIEGNGRITNLIFEEITECIPPAERRAWYDHAATLVTTSGAKVIHFVNDKENDRPTPPYFTEQGWTWQTLEEWAAEEPTHYWISVSSLRVISPA